MKNNTFKLRKRIPWIAAGLLGLQLTCDLSFLGTTPTAEAFTPSVGAGQTIDGEIVANGEQTIDGGTANNTVIDNAGEQNITNNGIADGTIINDGGTQWVDNGGSTTNTTVNDGGYQFVAILGSSDTTVVNNGGTQSLQGGTSNNTVLNGGLQEIQQTSIANGTVINSQGEQEIKNGGIANNTVINSGGAQWIEGGGLANITEVNDGGVQFVALQGTAQYSTVNTGGLQSLQGGTANHTILNGGIQEIQNTSVANDTVINSQGEQEIKNGGTANNTTINNGGAQWIEGGGTANDTTVNNGGAQFVALQGTANHTTVNTGSFQSLQGGTANNTILNGGIQEIQQTSIANNTTINNGGYQEIQGLGTANDTIINNGGNQAIYSDGTANYSTAYTGGSITVMENGAKLTGTTTLDGGALRLHPASNDGSAFITAQVQNLAGNGSIYLNTNLEALTGDKVQISGSTTGSHQVFVNNQGGASVDPNTTLTIIETAGGGAFDLGRQTEVGGYLYGLRGEAGNQNNWELYSTGKATSSANASISAFTGSYLLNYAETQTLLQRMGDLRQGENRTGAWARVFGGKFDSKGDHFLNGFDMTYSGIQVGADKKIALQNGKGNVYVGGMFGYSKGDLDYGIGSGSIDSKTLGAYGTYIAPTGFYTDLVLKYGWMKNDFKVLDTAGTWVTGNDMNTSGLSASLEVGQRIHFDHQKKEGWYLEPQAQLSVGHQGGGSFNASNGLRVNVDSYNSTLGRLGVNVGYEMKSGKNPINVYAKTSYVHEFDGDVGYRMNGISEQTSFGGSWWTYGVGVTAQINKNHNVYLDIERASGGKFTQPWSISGGYRFQW